MLQCLLSSLFIFLVLPFRWAVTPKNLTFPIFNQLGGSWCFYFELLSQYQEPFSPFVLHHLISQSTFHSSYSSSHASEFGSVWMRLICIDSHTSLCDSPNEIIGVFGTQVSHCQLWMLSCSLPTYALWGWAGPGQVLKHRAGCNLELCNCRKYSKAGQDLGQVLVLSETQSRMWLGIMCLQETQQGWTGTSPKCMSW